MRAVATLSAACALLVGCIQPSIDKPPPPEESSSLRDDYSGATATLRDDTIGRYVDDIGLALEELRELCGWESIDDMLCATPEECATSFECPALGETQAVMDEMRALVLEAQGTDGETIVSEGDEELLTGPFKKANGFITVRRTCGGFGERPTVAPENGRIVLSAGFTDRGVDPVLWADLEACQERVFDRAFTQITVSGRVILILGDGPINPSTDVSFLTGFNLQIETDLGTADVAGSFFYDPAMSRFLMLIRDDEGRTALFYSRPGSAGILTADGAYECDFPARSCISPSGTVVTW